MTKRFAPSTPTRWRRASPSFPTMSTPFSSSACHSSTRSASKPHGTSQTSEMSTAQRIFDDLLSLEINVVLKSGMTARKMPEPPYALLDIVADYDMFLCNQGHALNKVWGDHGSPPVQVRPPEKEQP